MLDVEGVAGPQKELATGGRCQWEEGGWLGPCPHLFLALEHMDGWSRRTY